MISILFLVTFQRTTNWESRNLATVPAVYEMEVGRTRSLKSTRGAHGVIIHASDGDHDNP